MKIISFVVDSVRPALRELMEMLTIDRLGVILKSIWNLVIKMFQIISKIFCKIGGVNK